MAMHEDLFERLEHDHAPMSAAMLDIREWFSGGESDVSALHDKLELLRELVIDHFGEEEETVFPILSELVPDASGSLGDLAAGHDAICGLAVRLGAVAARPEPDMTTMRALFDRLESSYSEHAQREQAILRAIRSHLSPAALAELKARLQSLRP